MAFDVSYIFTARDKYSKIARKVAAANEKVRRSAASASASLRNKLSPALVSIRAKAQSTKAQIAALARTIKTKFEPAMRSVRNVGLGMTAAVSLPFILAARASLKFASDAEETRTKFATVFQSIGSEAESVADNFAKNFGLAGATSRELLSNTGDLLTGFGFTEEGALDLSKKVNELAVDLASFTNFSGGAEGASAALTKALLGERESLKSLGIAITEDLVKKKIATLVAGGARFASLAEAKAQATLAIAIDQSKNAQGDYARTQAGAANVTRLLTEKTKDLKEKYGKLLLPMQVKVTNALIRFVDTLNELSPGMQRTILIVAGLLAALGPILLVVGAIGLALPAMAAGFGAVGVAIAFLGGPVTIIIALIALIATLMLRSKKASTAIAIGMEKIVGAFQSMGKIVGGVIFEMIESISPLIDFVGDLIGGVIDKIKSALNFLGSVFDKFKGFAASLGLIDIPDKEIAITVAAIPAQQVALTVASIPDQKVALEIIPPEALADQEIALKVVAPENLIGQEGLVNSNVNNLITASPQVATANATATVNGQINVSASPGSQIDSVSQEAFRGASGNIGLGAAGQ